MNSHLDILERALKHKSKQKKKNHITTAAAVLLRGASDYNPGTELHFKALIIKAFEH